jgi:hypothetical protein
MIFENSGGPALRATIARNQIPWTARPGWRDSEDHRNLSEPFLPLNTAGWSPAG